MRLLLLFALLSPCFFPHGLYAEDKAAYGKYLAEEAAKFGPSVATFFDDVMVMTEDAGLREARLRLMWTLEHLILQLADVSEIVPQES